MANHAAEIGGNIGPILDPAHKSQFLELPSEVRQNIYAFYFFGHPRLITYPFIRPFSFIDDRHWALLRVSRSIYAEALPVYYRTCIFGVYDLSSDELGKLISFVAGKAQGSEEEGPNVQGKSNGNARADTETEGQHWCPPWAKYARKLLMWRNTQDCRRLLDVMTDVKWVKLLAITCGIESDAESGQIYTYKSLMKALKGAKAPGFDWPKLEDLVYGGVTDHDANEHLQKQQQEDTDSGDLRKQITRRYKHVDFMIDFRCDYPETRISTDGYPQLRWVKKNFVWDIKEDCFVEAAWGGRDGRREGLLLRNLRDDDGLKRAKIKYDVAESWQRAFHP